jgi:hypothetical protein
MTSKFISIEGWSKFDEQFKPKKNHLNNNSYYETYGEELEYIKSLDPHYVWTNVQGDFADILVNGVAFVNRLSYTVCEVPWEDDTDYEVIISVEKECECYDEDGYENGEYGRPDCENCEGYGYVTNYLD